MPSVYDPDNFAGRVSLAASYIAAGSKPTRSFDTCFEMYDGDAVATALYRRAEKNPDGALAVNLWKYLSRETVQECARAHSHVRNLAAWAREMRAEAEAASARRRAEQEAQNATQAAVVGAGQLTLF